MSGELSWVTERTFATEPNGVDERLEAHLLAWQERDGAWRWSVGEYYASPDDYRYWTPRLEGVCATEAIAQQQARDALAAFRADAHPWTAPEWAVPR